VRSSAAMTSGSAKIVDLEIILASALEERLQTAIETAAARIGATHRGQKKLKTEKHVENRLVYSDLDETDSELDKESLNRKESSYGGQVQPVCPNVLPLAPRASSPTSFDSHFDSIFSSIDGSHVFVRSSSFNVSVPQQIQESKTQSTSVWKESDTSDSKLTGAAASSLSADEIDLDSFDIGDVQVVPVKSIVAGTMQSCSATEESNDDLDRDWW
jgi:hypothetical protein